MAAIAGGRRPGVGNAPGGRPIWRSPTTWFVRERFAPGWRPGLAVALVTVLLLIAGCGDDDDSGDSAATPPASPPAGGNVSAPTGLNGDLTVFAAASLTDAFSEMKARLEGANPDLSITYNFAGSQQLATQLAEGAGADVFASANATQMRAAQDAGTISGEPVVFVRNRLAIVVPSDNPADVQEPADLARGGLKLVVANADVPVGGYTLDVLDKMSADPAFGADFRAKVEANIVSREANVRQVVTKVQLGEADAGVVYLSDVTPDVRQEVAFIEIPDEINVIAEYPVAPVEDGDTALARAFIAYLLSPGGQAVLERWGFTPLAR